MIYSPIFLFSLHVSLKKKSGEAEAASVLDERESKAKSLFKLSCHLTGAQENKWVKDENKQVCWKRA